MRFHHNSGICPRNTRLFNPHSEYMSKNKPKYPGVKEKLQYAKIGMTLKHKPLQPFFQNSLSACVETLCIRITDNLTQSTRHSHPSSNRGWSPISNCANQQESKCLAHFNCLRLKRKFMDPPGIPDSARSLFVLKHAGAVLAHLPSQFTYQPSPTSLS